SRTGGCIGGLAELPRDGLLANCARLFEERGFVVQCRARDLACVLVRRAITKRLRIQIAEVLGNFVGHLSRQLWKPRTNKRVPVGLHGSPQADSRPAARLSASS